MNALVRPFAKHCIILQLTNKVRVKLGLLRLKFGNAQLHMGNLIGDYVEKHEKLAIHSYLAIGNFFCPRSQLQVFVFYIYNINKIQLTCLKSRQAC